MFSVAEIFQSGQKRGGPTYTDISRAMLLAWSKNQKTNKNLSNINAKHVNPSASFGGFFVAQFPPAFTTLYSLQRAEY